MVDKADNMLGCSSVAALGTQYLYFTPGTVRSAESSKPNLRLIGSVAAAGA